MAFPAKKPKRDFLDDVVDEMGPGDSKNDGDSYGASMEEEPDEADMGDEEAGEDRVMAAKQVGKALGIANADWGKFSDALAAFVRNCTSSASPPDVEPDVELD